MLPFFFFNHLKFIIHFYLLKFIIHENCKVRDALIRVSDYIISISLGATSSLSDVLHKNILL